MSAAKSSLTADGFRKVGRTLYRWQDSAEMWCAVSRDYLRWLADQREHAAMLDAARTMPWHEFVCAHVAATTAREPVSGYSVRKAVDGWELCYMGSPQFPPMSASTAYSWFERLPLVTASRKADEFRAEAYAAK